MSRTGLAILILGPSLVARAQSNDDDEVVVIVESADDAIRADFVRAALRQAGVHAVSLTDEGAASVSDVLTVAVGADGRTATVQLRTRERLEVRFLRTRRPDTRGRWLTAPLAGLVRATRAAGVHGNERTNGEVLDPWGTEPRVVEVTEVVDPWEGRPPARMISTALSRVPATDVLDPWRDQPPRRPRARRTTASRVSDIVDPWANERGERLDSPRPRD